MEQHNYWLTEQLTQMRYDEIRRESDRERLLTQNGLDLWGLLRRAVGRRLPWRSAIQAQHAAIRTVAAPRTRPVL